MRKPWSLTTKLVSIGCTFLALSLITVGLTLWVSWQLEGGAAAVNEAGRMRMQSYRLALAVRESTPERATELMRQFDASLNLLRQGDPSRPLFVPSDAYVQTAFNEVSALWANLQLRWRGRSQIAEDEAREQAQAMAVAVDKLVNVIEVHMARWTSMMQLMQTAMLVLAVAAAVVLLYVAYIVVLEPVQKLQSGLQDIESGNYGTRVDVVANDEFGRLADGFNRMSERLRLVYQHLEEKVREKTASLALEQARLACLYDVTTHITHAASLDDLAQGFVRRIALVAKADAASIRWADKDQQNFVLLASHCLPESIVREEQCVHVGNCHCGPLPGVAATLRVIPIQRSTLDGNEDDAQGSGSTSRCAQEGFETVLLLPVRQRDRIIGEVALFYRSRVTLQPHEHSLLEALVSHLATALERFRLSALEREAAVSDERGLLAQELHDSLAQSLAFLKIQAQLLRSAMATGDAPDMQEALVEIENGIRESSGDVRELLMHFRTRADHDDIESALRVTLSKFEHQTGLPTDLLTTETKGLPIPADAQIQVLHVVQEALSNVRKHAGATRVRLHVQQSPVWRFEVQDDGAGFTPPPGGHDETHVGQRIMHERAARIGAGLRVRSTPGQGTRVVLTLPRLDQTVTPPSTVHQESELTA